MKRIYTSTVGRGKALEESSKIYCIDFDTGEILLERKLPLSMLDLGLPRGGCRGCRGLTWIDGYIWAAGYDGLFQINPETLFIDRGHWSSDCKDIHQIYDHDSSITVVSTGNNSVYDFSIEDMAFCLKLHLPSIFNNSREMEDIYHFNAMTDRYVLLNNTGQIGDLLKECIIFDDSLLVGAHDIISLSNSEVAINLSRHAQTVAINLDTKYIRVLATVNHDRSKDSLLAKHGWMRGMFFLPGTEQLLVGCGPAMVLCIDNIFTNPGISKEITISDDIVESVFDVLPHPIDWGL